MLFYNDKNEFTEACVRPAVPEDTQAIILLVRRCYGEVCSDSIMYDENALSASLRTGTMKIEVAADTKRNILGIEACTVRPDFPKTLYLKSKMTHPEYQKYGIGKEITRCFMNEIQFSSFLSAFAYALTYSCVSQSLLIRHGFTLTGMLYNSFFKSEDIPGCKVELPKRSHAVMVKNISAKDVGVIYLPHEYHDIARQIYASLGASVSISQKEQPLSGSTSWQTFDMPAHENTEAVVSHPGENFEACIDSFLDTYSHRSLQTFNVFLNLKDPSAITAYHSLLQRGFVCSGFQPLGEACEFLICYKSLNVSVFPEYYQISDAYLPIKNFFANKIASLKGGASV